MWHTNPMGRAALDAPVRVGVIADLLEEGWPSMDLVADMLMMHLGGTNVTVSAELIRPTFSLRLSLPSNSRAPSIVDRVAHRFWDYPRWLQKQRTSADVYHIVDHSYAHLAHELPANRVVTTCHDTDAFRPVISAGRSRSGLPRFLVNRVVRGLRRAAVVACDSEATRENLVSNDLVPADRTTVVPLGVHPSCTTAPDAVAGASAASLTGPTGGTDLLHVGSTIPRKRIDVLLDLVADVSAVRPDLILWRVGGPFTAAQTTRVRQLGIEHRIKVLPFVSRPVLAALYRQAALVLLPSSREGFGLPVAEAMACGTPVVASDLAVLREVGGDAAEYCRVGDSAAWTARVLGLLRERESNPAGWAERRRAGVARASLFSWGRYANAMARLYARVAAAQSESA